jgi:hypothetical protein
MTTKNATYGTGAGFAPPSDEHPIFEAMREATRLTLDECKVQWERERALHDACVARTIAELRAEVTALKADLERAVTERLSTLRDGVPGPRGEPGPPGREGRLRTVTEWSGGVHYEGDLIHHHGSLWQCINDTGRPPSLDDWVCLARAGRDGCDGRAPTVSNILNILPYFFSEKTIGKTPIFTDRRFVASLDDVPVFAASIAMEGGRRLGSASGNFLAERESGASARSTSRKHGLARRRLMVVVPPAKAVSAASAGAKRAWLGPQTRPIPLAPSNHLSHGRFR